MKKYLNVLMLSSLIMCGCSGGSSDGVVKKTLPVYFDVDKFNPVDICFFNGNLDIPYVEIETEITNNMAGNDYSCEQKSDNYVITNKKNKATMTINMSNGEVSIPDVDKFRAAYVTANDCYVDEFYYTNDSKKAPKILQEKVKEESSYGSITTYKVNLGDYGLAPIVYNNKGYLPIDVLPLLTSSGNGTYFLSDDKLYNIFSISSELIKKITPKTSYSKAFYEYSFDIFTLSVELYYGLKGYSKTMVYDDKVTMNYLPNGVRKEFEPYKNEVINSSSVEKFDETINTIINTKLIDGGHTKTLSRSFGVNKKEALPSDVETNFKSEIDKKIEENRNNSPDKDSFKQFVSLYDTNNDKKPDIGYLTFAGFEIEDVEATKEESAKTSIQTIMRGNGTTKGANALLNPNSEEYKKAGNSDIRDVIVDLTYNDGGSVIAEGILLSWLCGGIATQTLRCAKSNALSTFAYKFDVNGDGKFTKEDYLPDNVNVYVLSSRTTYSAANALPYDCSLYNRKSNTKRKVILMGEKTAGGACSITSKLFLPTGFSFQMSGCNVSVDPKDTSVSCESGVEPTTDYKLERGTLALRTGEKGINAFVRKMHPIK